MELFTNVARRGNGGNESTIPMLTNSKQFLSQDKSLEIHAPLDGVSLPKQTRIMLREMEDKYRSFFESIEQGYYEVDKDGNLTFFNDFICKILGYSKDELIGSNFRSYINRETAGSVCQFIRDLYNSEKSKTSFVFEIFRKDGAKRQIGTSLCLMKDAGGDSVGFRGIASDISERKMLEGQLQQKQKLGSIGQLAAGIAHEINTPIQYAGDNTRFLMDSFADIAKVLQKYNELYLAIKAGSAGKNLIREVESTIEEAELDYLKEEIPKAIEQSLEGLNRVAGIVLAMKDFSYSGTGEKEATDINKCIESTIIVARNEWKYVADIKKDLDPYLPLVPCYPGEFNQVILNLIINAAHAIADAVGTSSGIKGTITVTTRYEDPWTEICISDTGSGIPERVRPRIFDPFFTTKEVGTGSGQGLAISHSVITNRHGGKIGFETEMGKGTTFRIHLPMKLANE